MSKKEKKIKGTALQEDIIEYAPRNAVVKDYIALVDELFERGIL